jgi:hypothetical protein
MSENPELDRSTYELSKAYLKEALKHMMAAGRSIRDLSEFALEKFGDDFLPYVEQFYRDVRDGRIAISDIGASARAAILGLHVSAEERESMIREAAYYRSEKRGLGGEYSLDDWLWAEKQIDEKLARNVGLVVRGSKGVSSITAVAEKGLTNVRDAVITWVERKSPGTTEPKKAHGRIRTTEKPPGGEQQKSRKKEKSGRKTVSAKQDAARKRSP